MSKPALKGCGLSANTAMAKMDSRYSFTAQFLCSSAIFARRCAEIEHAYPDPPDLIRTEHLGFATSAIMQCAAAVEAESAELTMHGPGHHLGSNGLDAKAHALLAPYVQSIDKLETMERYKMILGLLSKPPLVNGEQPLQNMTILVKLRNEITHYKSNWGEQMDRKKLFATLRQLRLPKPSFVSPNSLFFPHKFLGAASAAWSVYTAVTFINVFYEQLGIASPLKAYMPQFNGLHAFP